MSDQKLGLQRKLLHTGADLLLTAVFRGAGLCRESEKGRKVSARELSGPPGPRPLTDQELRIKWVAPPQDEVSPGGKCPRVEFPTQDDVSTKVSTVTEVSMEVSTAVEVIKGDSQKADNSSVPDHLWLRAFVIGYGNEACVERHREGLALLTETVGALGASEPPAGWRGALPGLRLFTLQHLLTLMMGYYQCDLNVSEQFLNFIRSSTMSLTALLF